LGLFPGPEVTPEAAAALTGRPPSEAQQTLERLSAAHLVTPRADRRFVLHDLLRLYATELADHELAADERQEAVRRLYLYYAHAVEAAAARLYPYILRLTPPTESASVAVDLADDGEAVRWLDTEWDNLVAVVDSADDRDAKQAGCLVGSALRGYLLTRMRVVDWLTIARANLAAAREIGDQRAEAAAQLSLGDLHRSKGEYRTATGHYERVLALSRHNGWIEGQAAAHNNLSNLCYPQGKLRATADHLTHALELNHRAGRIAAHAANLTNLGGVQLQMGLLDDAVANLERAAAVHRSSGSHAGESHSLTTLGETFTALGKYDRARETLLRALSLQQEVDDRQHLPHALAYLSAVHLETGEHTRAGELAARAVEKAREVGNGRDAEATAIRVMASIDRAATRHERAIERYREALEIARKSDGMEYTSVVIMLDLADAYVDLGESGTARHYLDQALHTCRRSGYLGLLERATATRSMC
ncbi:MAG: tetratricopeptide repeat protein, partial [Nocardioidaceae bacterium]